MRQKPDSRAAGAVDAAGINGDRRVGITTTIPCEVLLAAGLRPVDLNNVFVSDPDPARLVEEAERRGFPSNICC